MAASIRLTTGNVVEHRGFTLIELLVVMAIIAILAAMLLPVLNRENLGLTILYEIGDIERVGCNVTGSQHLGFGGEQRELW